MELESTFFAGSNRRIILGSPTLQTTSRRICIPIRMPLTGESFVGMPDWVGTAYEAVAKYLTEASPECQQITAVTLAFHNDKPAGELFAPPSAKVSASELKGFSVMRVDDPDADPEVELQFKAYIPFTRDFWQWVGEMAGKEVYMAFPSSIASSVTVHPPKQSTLKESEPTEAETEAFAGDTNATEDEAEGPGSKTYEAEVRQAMGAPEAQPATRMESVRAPRGNGKKKSGPKDLAAYHAQHPNGESRRRKPSVQ